MIVSSKVTAVFHQKPLLDYLAGRFTYQTPETWQARIEAGEVSCNGRIATPQQIVHQGDVVACNLPNPPLPDVNLNYQVVYEDKWLLAVNKPGNLKVHGHGRFIQANLIYQLRHNHTPPYPEAMLINRLDRDTSGIVLLARDADTLRTVQTQFAERTVQKTYLAVIHGIPNWQTREVDLPIGRLPSAEGVYRFGIAEDGKPAQTTVELIQSFSPNYTFVRLTPTTGRTHQLRVHLAELGYPIVGDRLYTMSDAEYLAWCEDKSSDNAPLLRHALHCAETTIWHPYLERPFTFNAPLASDILTFLQSLTPNFADVV
ncbi:RluA family pseudouridine synthase [Candidatus Leptofilum sp.]|uniref:RluA family pseudouridine synthase n=1 Tax=Candidatus Leptofilum sp. TaxID=3241576 RepID=UPI003B5A1351